MIPMAGGMSREGDHRDVLGPKGKKLRKLFWANEATIVTMGRPPGTVPAHPNLVLAGCLTRPGEDPGGTAVRLLTSVRCPGLSRRLLGADRGTPRPSPTRFHLPVRALGYSLVMDYKETELGTAGQQRRCRHGRRDLLLSRHARSPRRGQC